MGRWESFIGRVRINLDVYAAAASGIAGLGFAVIGILGVTNVAIVLALAQLTLSALAVSVLRDRRADRAALASVAEISAAVRSLTHNQLFDGQDEPYGQLIDYINRHTVDSAVFIQYSGYKCADVLAAAVRKRGAKVTLYLQHETSARDIGSERQMDRITSSVRQTLGDLAANNPDSVLIVRKVKAPISVRAIRIDDQVLCVGWYTYEELDRRNREFPHDPVTVSGHDRPTRIVRRGTSEYEILNKMVDQLLGVYANQAIPVSLPAGRAI